MLDGLVFLPVADVPEGLKYLTEHTPEGLESLIYYSKNNICEAWNNSFRSFVGCSHPSIWRTIDNLRKDQNDAAILLDSRGQPLKKRVQRSTVQLQQRIHNLCTDVRDDRKSVEVTLRGIGHRIRWK